MVSLATTLASPYVSMHFLTAFRISCNRLSKARRWGSVSTGARWSCRRDSLITSLSRYSGSAKSCSRNNVVLFILGGKKKIRHLNANLLWHPGKNQLPKPPGSRGRREGRDGQRYLTKTFGTEAFPR